MSPFFDGPIFSILLCLLAGVALRYAIYHAQDCAANDEASPPDMLEQAERAFRERHLTLQGALDTALQNETALRARLADLIAEMDSLRTQPANESNDGNQTMDSEMHQRIHELEADVQHQESMLRELRLQKEEALTHLERERNRRQESASGTPDGDSQAVRDRLDDRITAHDARRIRRDLPHQEVLCSNLTGLSDLPRILAFTNDPAPAGPLDDVRTDPVRGPIYDRPPQFRDDLRRISGIGEILAGRLNQLGVYRYQQIMQWETRHVREFSRLLSFRDRIERDQWVAQARRLHREAQGDAA